MESKRKYLCADVLGNLAVMMLLYLEYLQLFVWLS